jgi:hypothetical protein
MGPSMSEHGHAVAARRILADFKHELSTAPLLRPPGREWMFRLADALAMVLDEDQADHEPEPYCHTCGSPIGIFIGHGDGWHHWRGNGTADSPVELYDAGHAPEVA